MYEDNEDRIAAADLMAEHDLRAASEVLSAIARDPSVSDEVRLSAAELLADLDSSAGTRS